MPNTRVLLAVAVVFIVQAVLVTTTPLRIGAFNLQIYGQAKSSMNSTVSIIGQVSGVHIRQYCCMYT